jgi:hypothetical protein
LQYPQGRTDRLAAYLMASGRSFWRAKDVRWRSREWIVILGEEFGADGPAVIDWLEDEAKLQNNAGRVKAGPRTVARETFVDAVTVGHVLSRAVTLGLLENFEERNGRFECTVNWWVADQGKAAAANRKADQRARESMSTGESGPTITVSHAESRPVTECPPTSHHITSQVQLKEDVRATETTLLVVDRFSEHVTRHDEHAEPNARSETWLREARLLVESDKRPVDQILAVIEWLGTSSSDASFWRTVVLSVPKLRQKFPQLVAKMAADGEHRPASGRRENASDWLQEDFIDGEPIVDAEPVEDEGDVA